MAYTKIAYEPHPVSPERKQELNKQGFQIIDARFAPEDGDAEAGEKPEAPARGRRARAQDGDE